MLTVRKGSSRRHLVYTGYKLWMSFDAEARSDPYHDGFRALKSLDEIRMAPGGGDSPARRRDMELLTYVQDGILDHENSLGQDGHIRSGEFQHMSKGTGITHSRSNGSPSHAARFFDCQIRPDTPGLSPRCAQKRFAAADRKGVFCLVASPHVSRKSFRIRQDVRVYSSLPDRGSHLIHELKPGRHAWLHVVGGSIRLPQLELAAGDGVAFQDEPSVSITALEPSDLLLFDLA